MFQCGFGLRSDQSKGGMMSLSVKGNYVDEKGCSAPNNGLITSMHTGKHYKLKYRTKQQHLLKNTKRRPGMQSEEETHTDLQ